MPVRGSVRCASCTAKETGAPVLPEGSEAVGSRTFDRVAGGLFLAGVIVSIFPWDRAGELTSLFSAWRPTPDPWPLLASLLLLLGGVTALRAARGGATRSTRFGYVALGSLATIATLLALPATGLTTRSNIPYVALSLAAAGTTVGLVLLGRRRAA